MRLHDSQEGKKDFHVTHQMSSKVEARVWQARYPRLWRCLAKGQPSCSGEPDTTQPHLLSDCRVPRAFLELQSELMCLGSMQPGPAPDWVFPPHHHPPSQPRGTAQKASLAWAPRSSVRTMAKGSLVTGEGLSRLSLAHLREEVGVGKVGCGDPQPEPPGPSWVCGERKHLCNLRKILF